MIGDNNFKVNYTPESFFVENQGKLPYCFFRKKKNARQNEDGFWSC